jgi:hypothetical protein
MAASLEANFGAAFAQDGISVMTQALGSIKEALHDSGQPEALNLPSN